MKNKFTVFYSWQSDLNPKENKNLISTALKKAIKASKRNSDKIELEISIDRDTKNKSGSPSITNTIFEKISNCDIFICDVSIINKNWYNTLLKQRLTPNPNVLIELGYAVNLLGWERIICLNNINISKNEELPFDIRSHRITAINHNNNQHNIDVLKTAIDSIINDYENIITRFNNKSHKQHDQTIYYRLKQIFSEEELQNSFSLSVNSTLTNQYYLDIYDNIERFYETTTNHFIDSEIETEFLDFQKSISEFSSKCSEMFREDRNPVNIYDLEESGHILSKEEKHRHLFNIIYVYHKEPYDNETRGEAIERRKIYTDELNKTRKNILLNYKKFIMCLKKKSFEI